MQGRVDCNGRVLLKRCQQEVAKQKGVKLDGADDNKKLGDISAPFPEADDHDKGEYYSQESAIRKSRDQVYARIVQSKVVDQDYCQDCDCAEYVGAGASG